MSTHAVGRHAPGRLGIRLGVSAHWAWLVGGFVVAFVVPFLLADVLEINRDLYYGLYALAVAGLFALWSRSTGYDLVAAAKRRWVLEWRRIALTEEQVKGLRIEPIWKVDGRDRQGRYAYEAEALGQAGLIKLVRATLDSLLPQPLQRVQERETAQREQLRALLDGWRNGGGDGARWRERGQRGRKHST